MSKGTSHNAETDVSSPFSNTLAPKVGRIVVHGQPALPAIGEAMLLDVLRKWPEGLQLKFLITPGGFVSTSFPEECLGGMGWNSASTDLEVLRPYAERALSQTVTSRVLKAAEGKIDVLTIGVDLIHKDRPEHAELVAVYAVSNRQVYWTGKSYPTSQQERHLVQVVDLETHMLELADERVLVLGCHDLNMFSPRGWASQKPEGVRRQRSEQMRNRARRFAPTVVLQHPHSTDTPNIWRHGWGGLVRELSSVKAWASGIGYHRWGQEPRASLDAVLSATSGGEPTRDFVVNPRRYLLARFPVLTAIRRGFTKSQRSS